MSVPAFTTGQTVTASNMNAIVSQVNSTTNGIATLLGGSNNYAIRWGIVNVTLSSAAAASTALSFGYTYDSPPTVLVSLATGAGGTNKVIPRSYSPTTSGTTIAVYTGDGTSVSATAAVAWLAIGY